MDTKSLQALIETSPVLGAVSRGEEVVWINPALESCPGALFALEQSMHIGYADIVDAAARLERFAPFIATCFPQTAPAGGIIESDLVHIPGMHKRMHKQFGCELPGRLYLKRDSDLAVAGSVKARGGIYEVLTYAERLALEAGLLDGVDDDYTKLAEDRSRAYFGRFCVQVGSTGNLGISIGITSAALGFRVRVHMSADAKQWKKDLLRSRGVEVIEYEGDYEAAVATGRAQAHDDPLSYFVDDEQSRTLFLGYAVASLRLNDQLRLSGITIDTARPLFVYIPCGVGGAPGGIAFGLKHVFGDAVHVFFVEPTQAPCMLCGMASGLHSKVCVQDFGLSGITEADGLAPTRPSGFVGPVMRHLLSGEFTISDARLVPFVRALWESEQIFVEPSAAAAFQGPARLMAEQASRAYIEGLTEVSDPDAVTHIAWVTGGSLVPAPLREELLQA